MDLFLKDVASVDQTACVVDLGSGESDLVRTESMCNSSRLEDPNAKKVKLLKDQVHQTISLSVRWGPTTVVNCQATKADEVQAQSQAAQVLKADGELERTLGFTKTI